MSNAIDDAITAAKNAAANAPAETNQNLAPAGSQGTAVAPSRGAPLGVDDLLNGGLSVSAWLKVNEYGLSVGTDRTLFEKLPVLIKLDQIAYCYSVRYGNPAQYAKTYDRVTDVRGGSWANTVAQAQRIDPKASEFRSADIPFYLIDDVKSKDGKTVIAKAGDAVGHSLSITGWKAFQEFILKLKNDGVNIYNATVQVDLGHTVQTNAKGTWGILAFNNPTEVVADPD